MRIVLSGAQCTGKSTIITMLEELQRKGAFFPEMTMIKEVVRTLKKERPELIFNKEADHDSQKAILEEHYRNCLKYDAFVSDRGSIDSFVYGTWNYLKRDFTFEQHQEHKRIFEMSLPYYDIIFYLKPEIPLKEDGVRDIDPDYQKEIHRLFITMFENNKDLPMIVALTGSVEERVEQMFNAIRAYLLQHPHKK